MSVNVPPRSIQNCQRPGCESVMISGEDGAETGDAFGKPARGPIIAARHASPPVGRCGTSVPLLRGHNTRARTGNLRDQTAGDSMRPFHILVAGLGVCLAAAAGAQTKWDMPTAYPPTNFHTENIMQFVADVDKA